MSENGNSNLHSARTVTRSGNANLHAARKARQDEFYTRIEDVEAELWHYREHFRGKTVYLNCDDPRWSAFWRYFCLRFGELGIERLIATHYTGVTEPGQPSFKIEAVRGRDDTAGDGVPYVDPETGGVQSPLEGDGDFRSDECVELLEQSDIVVTNPPFSLARSFVQQLVEHDKKFVIIGNKNAITYKEVWPLIQGGKLWVGVTPMSQDMLFDVPDDVAAELVASGSAGSRYRVVDEAVFARASAIWFTNLDHAKRHEELPLWKRYTPEEYPKYDNYDAINVDKVKEIPCDYDGAMGVPITFLDKWNPEQFELLGSFNAGWAGEELGSRPTEIIMKGKSSIWNGPVVEKKPLYKRIVIRRK